MQHDDEIGRQNLVEQMGRPQHAEALFLDERAHDVDDALARADVEADGRLVEQQQIRTMQQRTGDLDAARLAARKLAHLLAAAIGEADEFERLTGAPGRLAVANPCNAQ